MATIKKRGNSYQIRVYTGYGTDGKQKELTKTWTPPYGMSQKQSDKEAAFQATLFEQQIQTGITANPKTKLTDFANYWMTVYAIPNLKAKTVTRYKGLMVRINANLGHISLNKIHPGTLLEFYKQLAAEQPENVTYRCVTDFKELLKQHKQTQASLSQQTGVSIGTLYNIIRGRNTSLATAQAICTALSIPFETLFVPENPERHLADQTVRHYHRLLSNILNSAVSWGFLTYSPCTRISLPELAEPEISYLDDIQANQLLKLLSSEPCIYYRPICLLLFTGLRRGELLGLEWKDIDFKKKTMHISRTSQYLPGKGIYTETTKTTSSNRFVCISDLVVSILQKQLLWQQQQYARNPKSWVNSGRVVTSENGAPMHPDRLTRWFGKYIKNHPEVPPIHLHSLRHTYATLLLADNVPITAVAAQLGHSNVGTTERFYAHNIQSAQILAAQKIDKLFEEPLQTHE